MILFFGTRPGKKTQKRLEGISCEHCGQTETLTAISQPNYVHVFWIPLYKMGTSFLAECSHCKRVYYKEEFTPEMNRALR